MQKSRKEVVDTKLIPGNEEMDTTNPSPADNDPFPNAASSAEAGASANQGRYLHSIFSFTYVQKQ